MANNAYANYTNEELNALSERSMKVGLRLVELRLGLNYDDDTDIQVWGYLFDAEKANAKEQDEIFTEREKRGLV